jgi:signal transduction histidine kinase
MDKPLLKRGIPLTIIVPLLIASVIAILVANELSYRRSVAANVSLTSIIETRIAIQRLKELAIDAETGQRGYLLTGKEAYLKPYLAAITEVNATLDFIREKVRNDEEDLAQLALVSRALARKLGELALTIELRQTNQEAAWRSAMETDHGKLYMDTIRVEVDKLLTRINNDASVQQAQIQQTLTGSRYAIGIGAFLSVIAFMLYLQQTRRIVAVELEAKQQLRRERDSLESVVAARTAELRELANHLETAREDERAHLARELHDELGALLTAAKLDVARLRSRLTPLSQEVSERIDHLSESLNAGIALKREIIEGLRPSSLENLGLLPTLEILARETATTSGVAIKTKLEPVVLESPVELTAYRFVQEALTNVMKYAQAKNVVIALQAVEDYAELSITDDGVGFDMTKLKPFSYGLTGMRQRVEASGGRMQIKTKLGGGTELMALLPQR